jgi:Glycosyl hydrolase catalytic core
MRALLAAVAAVGVLFMGVAGCGSTNGPEPEPVLAPGVPREFFGVVPQAPPTDEDLARMDQGNVGTIRMVVPWGGLEPIEGGLELAGLDAVVLRATQGGMRIVPTIFGTPDWVAEGLNGYKCSPGCGPFAPTSDEALDAWGDFVSKLVARYGQDGELWDEHPDVDPMPIRAWQIWNEQNSPSFYQPKVDVDQYAALLRTSHDAITNRDPGAKVVLGGMFGTPFNGEPPGVSAPDFLRRLYAIDGARDTFDGVAAHPYAARLEKVQVQVDLLHDEIVDAGDNADLWITEVGNSSDDGSNPLELGPEGQAEQLREIFEYFIDQREALDIESVSWYAWRDTSDPSQCEWCPGAGLFTETTLEPKPSWDEFVAFTGGS